MGLVCMVNLITNPGFPDPSPSSPGRRRRRVPSSGADRQMDGRRRRRRYTRTDGRTDRRIDGQTDAKRHNIIRPVGRIKTR